MKVLMVSGIYFPDIGGPASYLPRLAHALIKLGYEVQTVSLTDSGKTTRPVEPWQRLFVLRKTNKITRTYKLIRIIRRAARKSDFVFINGLYVESAVALYGLRCYSTAKVVGDPVWERVKNKIGTPYTVDEFAIRFTGLKNFIHRKITNFALSRFDQLTAPSNNLATNIRNWGVKGEVVVIANGVKCLEVLNVSPDYDVVSLARLVEWKRIDVLIRACAMADLRIAIAGVGPEKGNLEKIAHETQCDAHFLGQLDREESIDLLQRSKIFALISTYEGLSFSLIEAMMLEKRILVSNAPGNQAVITNQVDGLISEASKVSDVADMLKLLNSETIETIKLGVNARVKAQKFFCEEQQLVKMTNLITETHR